MQPNSLAESAKRYCVLELIKIENADSAFSATSYLYVVSDSGYFRPVIVLENV